MVLGVGASSGSKGRGPHLRQAVQRHKHGLPHNLTDVAARLRVVCFVCVTLRAMCLQCVCADERAHVIARCRRRRATHLWHAPRGHGAPLAPQVRQLQREPAAWCGEGRVGPRMSFEGRGAAAGSLRTKMRPPMSPGQGATACLRRRQEVQMTLLAGWSAAMHVGLAHGGAMRRQAAARATCAARQPASSPVFQPSNVR